MRRTFVALAFALVASPALALEFRAGEVGVTKTVVFDGVVDGRRVEGLSGRMTVRLLSATKDGRFRFAYTFQNTSSAPFTRARASVWGFDIPDVTYATSTAPFRFMGTGDTVGVGNRDVCFGSRVHENCREGDGGVRLGQSGSGTFAFRGAKNGRVSLDNLFVRWTDLTAPSLGLHAVSGYGQEKVR